MKYKYIHMKTQIKKQINKYIIYYTVFFFSSVQIEGLFLKVV